MIFLRERGNNSYLLNGNVSEVITYNDTLFTTCSHLSAVVGFDYAGYFTGAGWQQAGSSFNSKPYYIKYNGELFAYGGFTTCGSSSVRYFAKWQNRDWVQAGPGEKMPVYPVVFKNTLYAFTMINQSGWEKTYQLMEWSGSDWILLAGHTIIADANNIRAITADGQNIYIAGDLIEAGNQPENNAARFDGSTWHPLGGALDTVLVNTLIVYKGNLYAGTSKNFNSPSAYFYKYTLPQVSATLNPAGIQSFYFDHSNSHLVFPENFDGRFYVMTIYGGIAMEGSTENGARIALDHLPKGIYIVKVTSGKGIESKKIIK